ncbi:MAG: PAS domain-containing sensor histidine kinase [Thermodesulfovibrionales bacterium]
MDKRGYVQDEIEELFATWLRRTSVIGAIVFPLFSVLDLILFYEHFAEFLGYRFAIAAFLLLIAFLAGRTKDRTTLQSLALAAVIAASVTIEVMILHTGGHTSPHVMGMILLAVTILAFVPADLPFHSAAAGTIYGIYLLPIFATEQLDDRRTFFMMNFFICSIILTVMAHRYLAMKGVRKQLENEYDLIVAGDRLRESEERQRLMLQNANDAIYVHELSPLTPGRFLEANDCACRMLGYTRDEFLAMDVPGIDVPEQGGRIPSILRQLADSGSAMFETEHLAKDGRRVPVEVSTRLFHLHGKPTVLSVVRDITERKMTEESLNNYRSSLESMVEKRTREHRETIAVLTKEIAQRIDAQEALGRNRLLLQGVFNSIQDGIILLDPDLNILMTNTAAERMFNSRLPLGYKTKKCSELFRNTSDTCEDCPAVRAMETKVSQSEIISYTTGTAQEQWLEIFSFPFLGQEGELRGVIQHLRDITERRLADETLKESEERFKMLLEDAPIAISIVNRDNTVSYVNRKHAEILGYAQQDIPTLEHWWSLAYPDETDRARIKSAWPDLCRRVFRGEMIPGVDRWIVCKDGTLKELELNFRAAADKIIVAFGDITERKRAEDKLRESEERYRRLLASVTDYIYTVTVEDGRPVDTSHGEGCRAVTGYSKEDFDKDPDLWYRMVHEDDRGQVLENARRIIAGERTDPLEHRIIHSSGSTRWVLSTLVPLFGNRGQLLAYDGLISNITERKRLEEELNAAWETEALSQKLFFRLMIETQEKERWSIARELHDEIGQSLTGLKLSVESIAGCLPSDLADDMKAVEVSLGEMLGIVRTMSLNLRPVMLEDFGLVSSLQWYFDRYESQTGISVTFRQAAAGRRFGRQKEIALYRITQEALANVARYAGVKSVLVELAGEQDMIRLRIRDTGRGFDTLGAASSFSSGLSIMRERTMIENGTFTLSSAPGNGTEIIAAIPLHDREDGQQDAL